MKPSIGIEIEVNWSAYFPQEYAKWFCGGKRKYSDFNNSERQAFDEVCNQLDARMLPLLEDGCKKMDLTRGKDAYWEFVFPPLTDISEVVRRIEKLNTQGLLPLGQSHSLHITVAGLIPSIDSSLLATCLELLSGVTAPRVQMGIHPKDPNFLASWARRGNRGIRVRPPSELLLGAEHALEFRMLVLPDTLDEIQKLLKFTQNFSEVVTEIQAGHPGDLAWTKIHTSLGSALRKHGLNHEEDWGNPNTHGEIWKKYADFLSTEEAANQRKMLHQVEL